MNEHDFLTRKVKHEPFLHIQCTHQSRNYRLEVNYFHIIWTYAVCYASVASGLVSSTDRYNHLPTHCAIQQARPTAISDEIVTDVQGVAYSLFPYTKIKLNDKIHYSTDK